QEGSSLGPSPPTLSLRRRGIRLYGYPRLPWMNSSYSGFFTNTKCCSTSPAPSLWRTLTVSVLLSSDKNRTFLPSLKLAPLFIFQSVTNLLSSQPVLELISISFTCVMFSAPSVVNCHTRVCSPSAFFHI